MARNPSLNESRGAMISNADQTALASDVQDSMDIIKNGVIDFVYRNRPASYRVIATELRKLLCDKDAVRSFDRKSKRSSLFELRYGRGDKIHLQAFAKLEPQIVASDWRDAGPAVYLDSVDILRAASGGDHLLSLWHWLKEESVLDARGSPVQTHRVLKDVADKEGAHIINWKADWRDKAGVALVTRDPSKMTTEELASADYEIGWKQFIVGAGARLLFARRRNRSGSELIFNTADMIPPPTTSRTSKMTLQMRT